MEILMICLGIGFAVGIPLLAFAVIICAYRAKEPERVAQYAASAFGLSLASLFSGKTPKE